MITAILITMLFSGIQPAPDSLAGGSVQPWHVYILAGQSNMEGLGLVSDLPDSLKDVTEGVLIYHPNRPVDDAGIDMNGQWLALQPGHGSGFGITGETPAFSDKFGPELTFARELIALDPGKKIALFKYARGGSALDGRAAGDWGHWDPDYAADGGINQWGHFEYHFKKAMSVQDIDGDGKPDVLLPAGIIWLQGESDASYSQEIAEKYLTNFKKLIGRMRQLTGVSGLPVVIARISTSPEAERGEIMPWASVVQEAQEEFARTDPNAGFIHAPAGYGWLDPWHYDSETYLELGRLFARSMHQLYKNKPDTQ